MLYLDTSALAKLYVREPETSEVRRLVGANSGLVFTSIVTYAEMLAVLARCRKELGSRKPPGARQSADSSRTAITACRRAG